MLELYFIQHLTNEEKQTRESDRSDQKKNSLGEKLTMREIQVYKLIVKSGLSNLSSSDIGKKVFGDKSSTSPTYANISRIKDKIGSEEIICNKGNYSSRRVSIEVGAI
jgi:hypothetical protein